jgi:hypothetical protein
MTASLASKLSLQDGVETVDLGNLRGRGKEFVSPNFFMVGRLNSCKAFNVESFKGAFRSLWRLNGTVDVQARADRFLFTFTNERDIIRVKKGGPWSFQRAMVVVNDFDGFSALSAVSLDFVWVWVQIQGIPPAYFTEATIALLGETLGRVMVVDQRAVRDGLARVRIELLLHKPVRLEKKVRFSPSEEYNLTFKYDRLLGRCRVCARLDHVGAPCPEVASLNIPTATDSLISVGTGAAAPTMVFRANIPPTISSPLFSNLKFSEVFRKEKREVVIRPLPSTSVVDGLAPMRITGVVREREDDVEQGAKRSRHALNFEPQALQPEQLGLACVDAGLFEVTVTSAGGTKRPRGRPRGHRNKPKEAISECPSSPVSSTSAFSEDVQVYLPLAGKGKDPHI